MNDHKPTIGAGLRDTLLIIVLCTGLAIMVTDSIFWGIVSGNAAAFMALLVIYRKDVQDSDGGE